MSPGKIWNHQVWKCLVITDKIAKVPKVLHCKCSFLQLYVLPEFRFGSFNLLCYLVSWKIQRKLFRIYLQCTCENEHNSINCFYETNWLTGKRRRYHLNCSPPLSGVRGNSPWGYLRHPTSPLCCRSSKLFIGRLSKLEEILGSVSLFSEAFLLYTKNLRATGLDRKHKNQHKSLSLLSGNFP